MSTEHSESTAQQAKLSSAKQGRDSSSQLESLLDFLRQHKQLLKTTLWDAGTPRARPAADKIPSQKQKQVHEANVYKADDAREVKVRRVDAIGGPFRRPILVEWHRIELEEGRIKGLRSSFSFLKKGRAGDIDRVRSIVQVQVETCRQKFRELLVELEKKDAREADALPAKYPVAIRACLQVGEVGEQGYMEYMRDVGVWYREWLLERDRSEADWKQEKKNGNWKKVPAIATMIF